MWLSYKASACILSFSMQHRAEATLPLARFSRINRYVVGVTGPQVLDQAVYDLLWPCVPPGPSRKMGRRPSRGRLSAGKNCRSSACFLDSVGNSWRTRAMSIMETPLISIVLDGFAQKKVSGTLQS